MAKRLPRGAAEIQRHIHIREPYARVLMVCEGSKTEPLYLKDLCANLRLAQANIAIVGSEGIGSSPSTLVEYALGRSQEDDDFDYVFCVFDRDAHADYARARDRCRSLNQKKSNGEEISFCAITSNPSFEFWLILHYGASEKPYSAAGKKSSGDRALSDLKKLMPNYKKGNLGVFGELLDRLPEAIKWARVVNDKDLENPHTRIVDLYCWLTQIKANKRPVIT